MVGGEGVAWKQAHLIFIPREVNLFCVPVSDSKACPSRMGSRLLKEHLHSQKTMTYLNRDISLKRETMICVPLVFLDYQNRVSWLSGWYLET